MNFYTITGGKTFSGAALDTARFAAEKQVPQRQANYKVVTEKDFQIDPTITDDWKNGTISKITGQLGTAIYEQVTFGGTNQAERSYYGIDGNIYTVPSMTFDAVLIDVSFPRNIVKTEIQGRNGTVKEYIGEGDPNITFRGVITGKNGQRPSVEIANLKEMIKAPISIPVISNYLNSLDIYYVVFEERSLSLEEGGYSYQAFSLSAIGDSPLSNTI